MTNPSSEEYLLEQAEIELAYRLERNSEDPKAWEKAYIEELIAGSTSF